MRILCGICLNSPCNCDYDSSLTVNAYPVTETVVPDIIKNELGQLSR